MKKQRSSRSGFSGPRILLGLVLGSLSLLFALVGFGISSGTSALAQTQPVTTNSPSVRAKIAPNVLDEVADGREASVVILLADQADVSAAYTMRDHNARGWFVYNTLTRHAAATQTDLKAFLTERGVSFQSFWAANMIIATADRSLVESLAGRADVARIDSNKPVRWIEDPAIANFEVVEKDPKDPAAVEWGINNVRAPLVWDLGFTGQGIVIGNLDTGMRWTHNVLKPKYRGWNGTTADHNYNWHDAVHSGGGVCGPDTMEPCDDGNHGTHTTGTTVGDDGSGNQVGVAPGAKWIGCRDMDQGDGTPATYTECFQFMIAPTDLAGKNANPELRPHVLNNSWGCPASEGCVSRDELELIVNNTQAAGILVEVSAGNSGPGCSSVTDAPAIYSASFSTGAINITNGLANFSSRGPSTFYSPELLKPNISAPGVSVRSSTAASDSSFSSFSGTSMAGPHVVGVVALLWSARPELERDIEATKTILQNTANPAVTLTAQTCGGTPSTQIPNNSFGYGRVDALRAVQFDVTPTPTPTPTATPAVSPTPTPNPTPSTLANISTRLRVESGDNALIGGFIVTGTEPKRVIVRAIGSSLPLADKLADPVLELRSSTGELIRANDNWRTDQEKEIMATTLAPSDDLESAIVAMLPANNASYTAIVRGAENGTGIGLVEAYDLDSMVDSKLANISTRGLVGTGNDVLIAGTIVRGENPQRVIVRAIGPSLNIPGQLADPALELRDGSGTLVGSNNNWRSDQEAEILATGIPPSSDLESALVATLPAGGAAYTVVVSGADGGTGIALVEIYALN